MKGEIAQAIAQSTCDGYWLRFEVVFLGRQLHFGGTALRKLSLFRKGKGRYEERLSGQDISMADIEIHEHVIVDGRVGRLRHPVRHENINSLDRYIQKHNEYSNWEARVHVFGRETELKATPWGNQAQRRRWLRKFLMLPGTPLACFLLRYFFLLGFLDGIPGLIFCEFLAVQFFHTKAKVYQLREELRRVCAGRSAGEGGLTLSTAAADVAGDQPGLPAGPGFAGPTHGRGGGGDGPPRIPGRGLHLPQRLRRPALQVPRARVARRRRRAAPPAVELRQGLAARAPARRGLVSLPGGGAGDALASRGRVADQHVAADVRPGRAGHRRHAPRADRVLGDGYQSGPGDCAGTRSPRRPGGTPLRGAEPCRAPPRGRW